MRIVHTASEERGQIYVPAINLLLALGTIAAVLIFRSSGALVGAYGVAVSALMAITTLLAALVALKWGFNPFLVAAVNGFFLTIDLIFLGANSVKLLEGGWFPLLIAGTIAFLMLTWRRGNACIEEARAHLRQPELEFLERLRRTALLTLPVNAAFLSSATKGIPLPLTRLVQRTGALPGRVLIVTCLFQEVPIVPPSERAVGGAITPEIFRIVLRYGFMEKASIPEGLQCTVAGGLLPSEFLDDATYFIGQETIIPVHGQKGMSGWRESLYAFLQRNAERSGAYFCVPARQVIEVGTEIEI